MIASCYQWRMAQVLIRDLDDTVVARLKSGAARRGLSMQAHLKDVLTAASQRGDDAAQLEQMRSLRAGLSVQGPTSAELIRQDRDSR